ncbi:hypothetical protein MBLNU230_g5368t1 [Neophaeotheca triangularis]
MSGVEVAACVCAVVSAFHGGAELITTIKEKRASKKRWRIERQQEMERSFQEKTLQTALQDGEHRVQEYYDQKQRQLGYAFRVGDDIATSQLKDIVINMQGEIIRSLQIAVNVEQAVLDLTKLHEASIANRMSAERSMDDLRQRIVLTMSLPRELEDSSHQRLAAGPQYPNSHPSRMSTVRRRGSNESMDSFITANGDLSDLPDAVTIPGGQLNRYLSVSRNPTNGNRRSPWRLPTIRKHDNDIMTIRGVRMHDNDDAESRIQEYESDEDLHEQLGAVHLQDDGDDREQTPPELPPRPSISLSTASSSSGAPVAGPSNYHPRPYQRTSSASTSGLSSDRTPSVTSNETSSTANGTTPATSEARSTRSSISVGQPDLSKTMTQAEIIKAQRKYSAPEVVHAPANKPSKRNTDPPTQRPAPPLQTTLVCKDTKRPWLGFNTVPWIEITNPPPTQPPIPRSLDIWLPLPKPCKENNYHNFCKGSWLSRNTPEFPKDHLRIAHAETRLDATRAVKTRTKHWQCKKCVFKSEALDSPLSPAANKIFSSSSSPPSPSAGIRYRWLFLLKSHAPCKTPPPTSSSQDYTYACIFCAAEARPSALFNGLHLLIRHIAVAHPKYSMTAEVRAKTRAVVGEVADADDLGWDVNFPAEEVVELGDGQGVRRSSTEGFVEVA